MRSLYFGILLLALAGPAQAQQTLRILKAYAFDSPPGTANGAAYLVIENNSPAQAEIVAITGSVAKHVAVHNHVQDGDLRRMMPLDLPLVIPAGETLTMVPGGIHVMLMGLKAPLAVGDLFTLEVKLAGHDADTALSVQVAVFDVASAQTLIGDHSQGHMGQGHMGQGHMSQANMGHGH